MIIQSKAIHSFWINVKKSRCWTFGGRIGRMKSPWSPIGLLFLSGLLRVVGRAQDAQSSSYPNKNTSRVLLPPPPRRRHLTKIIPLGFSRKLRYERVKSICNECHPLEGFNPFPPLPIDRFRYYPSPALHLFLTI